MCGVGKPGIGGSTDSIPPTTPDKPLVSMLKSVDKRPRNAVKSTDGPSIFDKASAFSVFARTSSAAPCTAPEALAACCSASLNVSGSARAGMAAPSVLASNNDKCPCNLPMERPVNE